MDGSSGPHLQVANDAVLLWPLEAAGGGGRQVGSSSNQKVSGSRVATSACTAGEA